MILYFLKYGLFKSPVLRVEWLLSCLFSYMMHFQLHLVILYTSCDLILMSIWSLSHGYCFVLVMLIHIMFYCEILLLTCHDHLGLTHHEGF